MILKLNSKNVNQEDYFAISVEGVFTLVLITFSIDAKGLVVVEELF